MIAAEEMHGLRLGMGPGPWGALRLSMARGSFLSDLRRWAGVNGGYGLEAPTHLLRALYIRDHCAIQVPGVPAAIGVSPCDPHPDVTGEWMAWWSWLIGLDVLDLALHDAPGRPAVGSKCPPRFFDLLEANAIDVAAWTTTWRTQFREQILPQGTAVERQLALDPRRPRGGLLTVRVLPLQEAWLSWVDSSMLLVSQELRTDPSAYADQATATMPINR